jgi:sugar phosphate isomerase/epimerase
MPHSTPNLSLQLWTLRDSLKAPAQIATTLKRLKQIGYPAVELAGLGKIDPKELAKILKSEGLVASGSHVPMEVLTNESQRIIDEHHLLDCQYTAVPGHWGKTLADYEQFAAAYNALVPRFIAAGIHIGYHNHSHELIGEGGRTPLALLIKNLHRSIWFEIDTYWITHGGGDPVQWITQVAGRIPCVHLKDMAIDDKGQYMAEVGEGNLNWAEILTACREAGTKWYVVEEDECRRDPFESVTISLRNLQEMGLH